jgi:hypothetical protein
MKKILVWFEIMEHSWMDKDQWFSLNQSWTGLQHFESSFQGKHFSDKNFDVITFFLCVCMCVCVCVCV